MPVRKTIVVHDTIQRRYVYDLVAPVGKKFDEGFTPELTPKEMLALGVFGGYYLFDCQKEFPKDWFTKAKMVPRTPDPALNYFGVSASLPLSVWRAKGWINEAHDPRGWFQWYCRYYMGRRLAKEDARQIKRWKAITRHVTAIRKNCKQGDLSCRRRQRQAILHWAYDARKI